jgi:hypothetical protein
MKVKTGLEGSSSKCVLRSCNLLYIFVNLNIVLVAQSLYGKSLPFIFCGRNYLIILLNFVFFNLHSENQFYWIYWYFFENHPVHPEKF